MSENNNNNNCQEAPKGQQTLVHGFNVHEGVLEFYNKHELLDAVPGHISLLVTVKDPLYDAFMLTSLSHIDESRPKQQDDNDEPETPSCFVHPAVVEGRISSVEGSFLSNLRMLFEDTFIGCVVLEHIDNQIRICSPHFLDASFLVTFDNGVLLPPSDANGGSCGEYIVLSATVSGRGAADFMRGYVCATISDAKYEVRRILRQWLEMLHDFNQPHPTTRELEAVILSSALDPAFRPMVNSLAKTIGKTTRASGTLEQLEKILVRMSAVQKFEVVDCVTLTYRFSDHSLTRLYERERPRAINCVNNVHLVTAMCRLEAREAIIWYMRKESIQTLTEYSAGIRRGDVLLLLQEQELAAPASEEDK